MTTLNTVTIAWALIAVGLGAVVVVRLHVAGAVFYSALAVTTRRQSRAAALE